MKLYFPLRWLVIYGLCTLPVTLAAQWSVGGLINISFNSVNVDPKPSSEDYSILPGIGIGGVVDYALNESVDIHSGLMYLTKGTRIEEGGDDIKLKYSYLEIPLLLRYNFRQNETIQPYVLAGPTLGFLLGAKVAFKDGATYDDDETKGLDFGVSLGGGVSIPKGNKIFFGELRYGLGLANINSDADEAKVRNRGVILVAGVTIPLEGI